MTDGPFNLGDYTDDDGAPSRKRGKPSSQIKNLPAADDPPARFAAFLTEFAHLEDDPVVSAERWGIEGSEPIELVLRSGKRVRWAEQDQLFGPRLQRPLVLVTGHRPRTLSQPDVQLVAWAIVTFAALRAEIGEADEFREWWESYLAPRTVLPVNRADERGMRRTLADWRQLAGDGSNDQLPYVLLDMDTGERLARRLDFAVHVRSVRRSPISWPRLHGLALEYGWELDRIQFRPTAGGASYVDAKVFIVPDGWGQDA